MPELWVCNLGLVPFADALACQESLRAAATRGVREELERESARAGELGVDDVPAVRVGDRVLVGEGELERAGMLLATTRA